MRLVFNGLESPIEVGFGKVSTLQVENEALFARVARSLACGDPLFALEPYSLWEDGIEVSPSSSLLFVSDPLSLPWDDRSLMGEVLKRIEREFLEDEDLRREIEGLDAELSSKLLRMGFGMNSDYGFGLEWNLFRYLKFRNFGVGMRGDEPLLENLLRFLSLALDAGCKRVIVFVNLKTFLTKRELKELFEFVFRSNLRILLLENKRDESTYEHELKTSIDLHFLESL